MITRSAIETKEQKMYFSPAQVYKDIHQMAQVIDCTIEEATELEQHDYLTHGIPESSRDRWVAMAWHNIMVQKVDRRPRTKELRRHYQDAERVYKQFYEEAERIYGPLKTSTAASGTDYAQ